MKTQRLIHTLFALTILCFAQTSIAQVVINEYSCSNFNTIADNYGEFEDWVELYNPTGSDVDLTGWHLSDKSANPTKWPIPSGIVPAGGYLMVYCSRRDEVSGGNLHPRFKLTQTRGENFILADAGGVVVDQVTLVPAQSDHSRGRNTDGDANWGVFTTPTPGAANTGALQEFATKPVFDQPAGKYNGSVTINITSPDPNVTIYYTTDGTTPTNASTVASGPININTTTVIRARAISSDNTIPDSFIETNTYFIDETHTVRVLSIAGDNVDNLLNGGGGGSDIDGSFEVFDVDFTLIDEATGDYNKHGNDSWAYDQRGFDYITRDQYGYNYAIQNKMFRGKDREEFQRLIVKAAANDNYPFENGAHIRDSYLHSLSQVGDLKMDERTFEPCVLYLNGEYWGLYDYREKVDDSDFTDHYYDQDELFADSPNNIQFLKTWGGTWSEYGGAQAQADWDAFKNWVLSNDMTVQANYDLVKAQYNVGSLVDYVVLNSYAVCMDWLNWNTAWWRGLDPNGDKKKWRYVLWDMDASFGHYINYTGIPDESPNADPCNPELLPDPGGQGHVPILNKLMTNDEFYQYYVSRYIDLSNTVFKCDFMLNHLDSLITIITPEMPRQIARWGGDMATWQANVQQLRDFITDRCNAMNQGMIDCYSLTGPYQLIFDVAPVNSGTIEVNSVELDAFPWTGTYFGGIDIILDANENPGYIFQHWEMLNHTPTPSETVEDVRINISNHDQIIAHFCDETGVCFDGLFIPTAFSPNGDGINDVLNVLAGKDIVELEFAIYDRWGQLVFETKDPLKGWDGTFAGQDLNSGVFAYQVHAVFIDEEEIKKGGNITLMR